VSTAPNDDDLTGNCAYGVGSPDVVEARPQELAGEEPPVAILLQAVLAGHGPRCYALFALTKLDFPSLVDHPAQETATIRLIKRVGADDQGEASVLARIVKVGEGDDPPTRSISTPPRTTGATCS
jgi:hypothetical protein